MLEYRGKIFRKDLDDVVKVYGTPIICEPSPIKYGNKFHPNTSRFYYLGFTVSVFHARPIYYLHKNGEWRPLEDIIERQDEHSLVLNSGWESAQPGFLDYLFSYEEGISRKVIVPIFDKTKMVMAEVERSMLFTSDDFYPITSGDNAEYIQDQAPWSSVYGASSATARSSATCYVQAWYNNGNAKYTCERSQMVFDTSSLPDGDTISSATLYFHGAWRRTTGVTAEAYNIYSYSGDNTPDGDDYVYTKHGSTAFSTSIVDQNWNLDAGYGNSFSFNSSGLAAISKIGNTKLSIREANFDAANTTPNNNSDNTGGIGFSGVRSSDDEKLTVVHSSGQSVSISDTLAFSESLSALRSLKSTISDNVSLTESNSSLRNLLSSISDSLNLSENISALRSRVAEVYDSISLSEAISWLNGKVISVIDSINIGEALNTVKTHVVSVVDSINLSGAISTVKAYIINVSDSLHLTEAVSIIRSLITSVLDTLGLSERLSLIYKSFYKTPPIQVTVELLTANAQIELTTAEATIEVLSGGSSINI